MALLTCITVSSLLHSKPSVLKEEDAMRSGVSQERRKEEKEKEDIFLIFPWIPSSIFFLLLEV